MTARRWAAALAAVLLAMPLLAHAHKPSDSYLALEVSGATVRGQWDIALRDLDYAIGLDADADGAVTWGELRARHDDIAAYALARLRLSAQGAACPTSATEHLVDQHSDGGYAVLLFTALCPQRIEALDIAYALLFDLDAQHRGLVRVASAGGVTAAVLSPERPTLGLALGAAGWWQTARDYAREGVWHIWIGFDHLLFLLTLLLPAVLLRRGRRWEAASSFGHAFWDTLAIVTAFTLAHSLTLGLAALGALALPSRLVEAGIAASVLLAAANNVYPVITRRRWLVAFAFGLAHGAGFAAVLAGLGLPSRSMLLALAAFNLGVEAGQLAVVAAFLPLAYLVRERWLYRSLALRLGSVAVAAAAAVWLVERAFDTGPLF